MFNKKVTIKKLNKPDFDKYEKVIDLTVNNFSSCVEELFDWQIDNLCLPVLFIDFNNKGYSLTINEKCNRKELADYFRKLLLKYNSSLDYRDRLNRWYSEYIDSI